MSLDTSEPVQKRDRKRSRKSKDSDPLLLAGAADVSAVGDSEVAEASAIPERPSAEKVSKGSKRKKDRVPDHLSGDEVERPKEKKKRRKSEAPAEDGTSDTLVASASVPELSSIPNSSVPAVKKSKKRKVELETGEAEQAPAPPIPETTLVEGKQKKRDRRKAQEAEEEPAGEKLALPPVAEGSLVEKKKKKKKRKAEPAGEDGPDETKVKRRKSRPNSDHVDPSGDKELSEQAQKALAYAYLHVVDPASWKFNKAKQNWLVRNIWVVDAIPPKYCALTFAYLGGVKGGLRDNLLAKSRELISATPEDVPADTPEAQQVADTPASRARSLLDILEKSTPVV